MANNYFIAMKNQQAAETRWLKVSPELNYDSGIYILTRVDENGIKYAYIGQAKQILKRLGQHLNGFQHIDLSLKKHKLYGESDYGWKVSVYNCPIEKLDENERLFIKRYAESGYQLRNKTIGGQDIGKDGLDDNKPTKGYYDGVEQGKKTILREIKVLFDKYLVVGVKEPTNKIKERKLNEFWEMLGNERNETN